MVLQFSSWYTTLKGKYSEHCHFYYYSTLKTASSFYFCSLDWQEQLKAFSALFLLRKCGCEHILALKNINGFFFLSDLYWQVTFNRKPWQYKLWAKQCWSHSLSFVSIILYNDTERVFLSLNCSWLPCYLSDSSKE